MPYRRPRASQYPCKAKRSSAGLGLFACENIPRGSFVIEYFGPIMNEEEAYDKGGKYQFALENELTIDGSSRKNLARYINHSCKPNCEPEMDGKRIFIYATKNIQAGEELSYNYGKDYFDDYIKPYGCRCGNHTKKNDA